VLSIIVPCGNTERENRIQQRVEHRASAVGGGELPDLVPGSIFDLGPDEAVRFVSPRLFQRKRSLGAAERPDRPRRMPAQQRLLVRKERDQALDKFPAA
jgi:hypothetical protein